jgi:hypothetical protein
MHDRSWVNNQRHSKLFTTMHHTKNCAHFHHDILSASSRIWYGVLHFLPCIKKTNTPHSNMKNALTAFDSIFCFTHQIFHHSSTARASHGLPGGSGLRHFSPLIWPTSFVIKLIRLRFRLIRQTDRQSKCLCQKSSFHGWTGRSGHVRVNGSASTIF